jgi:hypothetical protein
LQGFLSRAANQLPAEVPLSFAHAHLISSRCGLDVASLIVAEVPVMSKIDSAANVRVMRDTIGGVAGLE